MIHRVVTVLAPEECSNTPPLSPRADALSRRDGKVESLPESYADPNTALANDIPARGKQRKTSILYCAKHKRTNNDKCFVHALNL